MYRPGSYWPFLYRLLVPTLLLACGAVCARAQEPPRQTQPVRVATRIIPPFVMKEGDRYEGFSIDLWRAIEAKLGVQSRITEYPDVNRLLAAVHRGRADLGISAISITSQREEDFDFSHAMLQAGLQIMVRDHSEGGGTMPSLVSVVFSPTLLRLLGIALLLSLVPAHLIWLLERSRKDGIVENGAYFPGIFKALWWSVGTLGAQADEMPRSPVGRLVALFWMFLGIAFVAYFTAVITASMTVQQLRGNIQGPDDLPGKRVATTRGSTSETYLRGRRSQVFDVSTIEDAYQALLNGKVDAVVFDAPVLQYYAAHAGKGKVLMVGSPFRKENYGILFPLNSPYRKRVNNALLSLEEDGTYQELYDKWFSSE